MATHYGPFINLREIIGESGTINVSDSIDAGVTSTIIFSSFYSNPVVFTFITTTNDSHAIQARVRNVTRKSCEIFIQRDNNTAHGTSETVSYLVMEEGIHELDNGAFIEVGSIESNAVYSARTTNTIETVNLTHSFDSTPVVIHSLNTNNNESFMSSMVRNVTSTSLQIQQNSLEAQSPVQIEKIVYAAITQGTFEFHEAGILPDSFTYSPITVNFTNAYTKNPDIIVKGVDVDGADGYFMRGNSDLTALSISVYTEEDQVTDSDVSHTTESPVYFACPSGTIFYSSVVLTRKYNS